MSVDARARAGLFLAMQYPVEIPGVSVSNFLRTAATAVRGEAPKLRTWVKDVNGRHGAALGRPVLRRPATSTRASPAGRRSGTRSCSSSCCSPKIAILDETDSGLDVDALKVVSEGVNRVREGGEVGVLLITHYTRILRYITPTSCTSSSAAGSSRRAAPSWPTSSRPRATSASPRRPRESDHS